MTRSVEEQMADIERRMKQLRARKQRIVARENAKARKRRTHLIIRLGGILSNEGVLGYDEGVWNDEGNRQRLLCLCSISCCGFSHDDFSGLGRACRPRNGLNWMVLVSPPERTGKDYDQHAPSTVYPSFAAERGIRRVDRAENTCQRADGA